MKKLTILYTVLTLFMIISGCSPENDTDVSPTPSITGSPSTTNELSSEEPAETTPGDNGVSNEVYTKVIQLEGTDETVNYMLVNGSFGYTIPIDVDRFEIKKGDEADFFRSSANENVYMAVSYLENTTVSQVIESKLEDTDIVSSDEKTIKVGDYNATNLHVVYGSTPDSKVINYYLINNNGSVYVISSVYFLEAAEGFGARMYYMTQDFKIE